MTLQPALDNYQTPDGSNIIQVTNVKDLGIIMSDSAMFESQVSDAIKRGSNMSSWIFRVFRTREKNAMMTLFRSLVLPHLEYCCQLWCPHFLRDIRRLEDVQRSFTVRIAGLENKHYWDRLEELKLFSLERRRERYIILYMNKILLGIVPNLHDDRFRIEETRSVRGDRFCKVPSINRTPPMKIRNCVENSFPVLGPKLFNSLPKEIRNFSGSPLSFKLKLDKLLLSITDKPCTVGYHQSAASNSIIAQLAQMRAGGVYL